MSDLQIKLMCFNANIKYKISRIKHFITGINETRKSTKNWIQVYLLFIGLKKQVTVKFQKIPLTFKLTKKTWLKYYFLRKITLTNTIKYIGNDTFQFIHPNGLKFTTNDNLELYEKLTGMTCYKKENNTICQVQKLKFIIPFPNSPGELQEIFVNNMYGQSNCKNAVVIDVGAFIGDSAIFYANKGAKKVIAYEPIPSLFEILQKNIKLNNYQHIIKTQKQAVSDNNSTCQIRYTENNPGGSGEKQNNYTKIFQCESIPLSQVIQKLGKVDILKMDCEGAEHKSLAEAAKKDALKQVQNIVLEAHSKVIDILKILKQQKFTITQFTQIHKELWIVTAKQK